MIFKIKMFLQRVFRRTHTSDSDLWSLDTHLAQIIAKKLILFRNQELSGIPMDFTEPEDYPDQDDIPKNIIGGGMDKWLETIEMMIFGFEQAYIDEDEFCIKYNLKNPWKDNHPVDYDNISESVKTAFTLDADALNEITERALKGRELFTKYFLSLWD